MIKNFPNHITEPSVLAEAGQFVVKLAENYEEIEKAQRLRYEVFNLEQGRGLKTAEKYGIDRASGDRLLIMDSDYNHQPLYIVPMIEMLRDCDCVVASRFIEGGAMDSRLRGSLSNCFNRFIRRVTGGRLSDYLYGYLAVKQRARPGNCDGCAV